MGTNLGDLLRNVGLKASESVPEDDPVATTPPQGPSSPSPIQRVVIRRTKKGRGGKVVTAVSGIPDGRKALAKKLRKSMGIGGRVEGDNLIFHGDQVERLVAWFEAQGVKKIIRG